MSHIDRNIPGLKFSSCHVLTNKPLLSNSLAFGCGATITPFLEANHDNIAYRSPYICICCGGILNVYARINPDTGEWRCPLCRSVNPSFHKVGRDNGVNNSDGYLRELYPELRSRHCEFKIDTKSIINFHSSLRIDNTKNSIIFAIDCSNITSDLKQPIFELLKEGLKILPEETRICLILYNIRNSNAISIIRLVTIAGSSESVIEVDCLPNRLPKNHLNHFISQGRYHTLSLLALKHFSILQSAITTICSVTKRPANRLTTVDVLIEFAENVSSAYLNGCFVRLVILASKPLVLQQQKAEQINEESDSLICYYRMLGIKAFQRKVWIDVICGSYTDLEWQNGIGGLDHLDALVEVSGGIVAVSHSFGDEALMSTFQTCISQSTSELLSHQQIDQLPTMEVRTCGRLLVDRIVGPILSAEELFDLRIDSISNSNGPTTASEIAVNPLHLAHTLTNAEVVRQSSGPVEPRLKDIESRIQSYNEKNTEVVGISSRFDRNTNITIQFKQPETMSKGGAKSLLPSFDIKSKRKSSLPTTVNTDEDEEEDEQQSDSYEDHSDGEPRLQSAYVQIIIRCGDEKTSVWTHRIEVTDDVDEYLQGLDEQLWGLVLTKGIVTDYHYDSQEAFGGVKHSRLDEQGLILCRSLPSTSSLLQ